MKLILKKLASTAVLAALILCLMAAGVATLFRGDGAVTADTPAVPVAAKVAPEKAAVSAGLPEGFHDLDKDIGFSTDFEGQSEPIRIMAANDAAFGGFAPKPDNRRIVMGEGGGKKHDDGASKQNEKASGGSENTGKAEGSGVEKPVGGGEQKPQNGGGTGGAAVPAHSGLSALIRSRAYTGGLDVFQSARGDIPADTSALMNALNRGGNRCSFVAVRLSDGASIAYNANALYKCASAYKAFVSLFAFRQAAAGGCDINAPLTYTGADYYPGSGIIKSSAVGTVYSLGTVADYSIRYSDNTAFIMLQRYLDRGALVEYGRSIGCPNYANFKDTWPDISALDSALWWAEIYNFANSSAYGKQLYDVFLSATHPCIRKALGDKYAVAHKSGSMSYYFHDTGIVHSEDPYLLVVLTHNPCNYSSENQGYLAPVVQEIDKLINP